MLRWLSSIVNLFEINLRDESKNRDLYRSLRELVTILFAVVLGVGLSELGGFKKLDFWQQSDFWLLFLAYVAVILSWWGYHWGTIVGPSETNIVNYFIDCLLLIIYWYLINIRKPFQFVLFCYLVMFTLYWIWEVVRSCREQRTSWAKTVIKKARRVNFLFAMLIVVLILSRNWMWTKPYAKTGYYIGILFLLIVSYRICIHSVYRAGKQVIVQVEAGGNDSEKSLFDSARAAAGSAKAHLSNFRVGAAVLSETGKIYQGCNIEFDNYSNTIHAEEAALSALITAGERRPVAIAVFTSSENICWPCGMCLQSLFELGGGELKVIACNENASKTKTISDLLPEGFHL